jgi:hypothetical protein
MNGPRVWLKAIRIACEPKTPHFRTFGEYDSEAQINGQYTMNFDHLVLKVPASKFDSLVSFVIDSFKHAGLRELKKPGSTFVGLGVEQPFLWINGSGKDEDGSAEGSNVALSATSEQHKLTSSTIVLISETGIDQVHKFHEAGLAAGGQDNGSPGRRPQFGPHFYGAFVIDPACGINFEMVYYGE